MSCIFPRMRDDLPERLERSAKAIRSAEPLKRKVQWTLRAAKTRAQLTCASDKNTEIQYEHTTVLRVRVVRLYQKTPKSSTIALQF